MSDSWLDAMRKGRFEEAWAISDRAIRERRGEVRYDWPRHLQNVWNGAQLENARVLIRCYHGLGDTLQFARYVPLVREIASEVTLWMQPELLDFLRPSLGGVRLLPLHDGAPDVECDVQVELMELPHVFRTTLAAIPAPLGLHVGPYAIDTGPTPVVGLVWKAGGWDRQRSLRLEQLEPLLGITGARFVPLQQSLTPREMRVLPRHRFIATVSSLARRIAACDLVIAVDTMAAHLSGSLGVPTWTLLKHDADWRWLRGRRDSPWYSTMRLYRQVAPHAWGPVIAEIVEDLDAFVQSSERAASTAQDANASR